MEWLQKQVVVDFPPGSEILQISVSGENPEDIAALANAVTDTYMKQVVEEAKTSVSAGWSSSRSSGRTTRRR